MDSHHPRRAGHVRLLSIGELEVDVHVAIFPLALVFAFVFATWLLPAQEGAEAYSVPAFWLMGAGATLLVLLSEALHEIVHAVVARACAIPVKRVTIFFHGASPEEAALASPGRELLVAASAPAATMGLAVVCLSAAALLGDVRFAGPLVEAAAVANFVLGTCYLLPALPLDGGRIVRAIAWGLTGRRLAGARAAAWSGRLLAAGLAGLGILLATRGDVPSGLMLAIFGLVLWAQASASWHAARFTERLGGLTVADLMEGPPGIVPRVQSVAEALATAALHGEAARAFLVEWNGRLGGIVTLGALRRVATEDREATPVGQVTSKLRREHVITPAMRVENALQLMLALRLPLLPVVSTGRLVGVLTRDAILRVARGEDPAAVRASPAS